jgi:PKD repeat protein
VLSGGSVSSCVASTGDWYQLCVAPQSIPFGGNASIDVGTGILVTAEAAVNWTELPPGCSVLAGNYYVENLSSVENLVCTPTQSGNFTIGVDWNFGNGTWISASSYLDVTSPIPGTLAGVAAENRSTILGNQSVTFSAFAEGNETPYYYSWDFGDGTPNATEGNVSHVYVDAGWYAPRLTIVGGPEEIVLRAYAILVSPDVSPYSLDVSLAATPNPVPTGTPVHVTASTSSPYRPYVWRVGWAGSNTVECNSTYSVTSTTPTDTVECTSAVAAEFVVYVGVSDAVEREGFAQITIDVVKPSTPPPSNTSGNATVSVGPSSGLPAPALALLGGGLALAAAALYFGVRLARAPTARPPRST